MMHSAFSISTVTAHARSAIACALLAFLIPNWVITMRKLIRLPKPIFCI
jgi:hypothetical protein